MGSNPKKCRNRPQFVHVVSVTLNLNLDPLDRGTICGLPPEWKSELSGPNGDLALSYPAAEGMLLYLRFSRTLLVPPEGQLTISLGHDSETRTIGEAMWQRTLSISPTQPSFIIFLASSMKPL